MNARKMNVSNFLGLQSCDNKLVHLEYSKSIARRLESCVVLCRPML